MEISRALPLLVLGCALLAGCFEVDEVKARRVLEAQGMTEVRIGGRPWFGCGKEDGLASIFTATGANGAPVSGVVCSGYWGKGITVRFD